MPQVQTIGLISDTHGLLRPEALALLAGSDLIVHAGDVGDPDILAALARLAPTTAVRGNVDRGGWALQLPETAVLQVSEAIRLHMLHDLAALDLDPAAAGLRAVIYGHSHKPSIQQKKGILFINPGSAGPRRFSLPISVGKLLVEGDALSAELIQVQA